MDVAGLKTTELHNWLESAGVTQIFLTGLTVENGIKTTALDAVKLGYVCTTCPIIITHSMLKAQPASVDLSA